jgi:hypothetical protein
MKKSKGIAVPFRFVIDGFMLIAFLLSAVSGTRTISTLASSMSPVATFMVTSTNDSGTGSLRQAMLDANANTGLDTISFAIVGSGLIISPLSELPVITDPVIIDGTTQGSSSTPLIELDGTNAGAGSAGFRITGGGTTVKGFVINRFQQEGIRVTGVGGNTIQGNFIGTDLAGTAALGNGGAGVHLDSSDHNTIGGTDSGAGNLISGNNSHGILLQNPAAANNSIQGNRIGTDVTGTFALGNRDDGIFLLGAASNTIGGTSVAARNLISANDAQGIEINNTKGNSDATLNVIQGNFIGTQIDGLSALGNGGNGVAYFNAAGSNNVGGPAPGSGNTIAFNARAGVRLSDDAGNGNRIQSNNIFSNGELGIDLIGDGVTPNDLNDPDTGPNNLQNTPILTSAVSAGGSTTIQGTLNSTLNTPFRVEFYSSPTCDQSGHGEGQRWLGFKGVSTTGNDGVIDAALSVTVADGQYITSVATSQQGNTSEFSPCILINAPPPGPTLFDFDGDGQADVSVFRPSDRVWYLNQSTAGFTAREWGLATDTLSPADYDGDRKTDIASWRGDSGDPDLSYFDIVNSADLSTRKVQFGRVGDLPIVAGDWDGDGKADLAVYRNGSNPPEREGVEVSQSNFYYRPSTQPGTDFVTIPWGASDDRPMRGDFDGDGKLDAAVFRASDEIWYILQSSNGQVRYETWGQVCDIFVPADYDGDGKTDLAVIRGGTWYIKRSSDGQAIYQDFGFPSDIPVPADYDGDNKTDIAIFRNGDWYILQSTSSTVRYVNFGLANDVPVESAYTYSPLCN